MALEVPEEARVEVVKAWQAARDAWQSLPVGVVTSDNLAQTISSFIAKAAEDAVEAAAPLIVAAELERLAAPWQPENADPPSDELEDAYFEGIDDLAGAMRARASVLRGEGAQK